MNQTAKMSGILTIAPEQTALVLIDLQKGILSMPGKPHDTSTVLKNAVRLVEIFHRHNALVVLVHVGYSADGGDAIDVPKDTPQSSNNMPNDWMEFPSVLKPQQDDVVITKRQWGAFYGTELDLQLRRRDIDTLVVGGIATNYGVESTARDAFERNYTQVFAEDAMTSTSKGDHHFSVNKILKRIGCVRSANDIIQMMKQTK